MRIVVNHLTRMQPGFICVAGVDADTGKHVRPVLAGERLGRQLLHRLGGPFDMATLVDLGATKSVGRAPELEDHLFTPDNAKRVRVLSSENFWSLLTKISKSTLSTIFGPALQVHGRGRAVDVGEGRVSLGCLLPETPPTLWVDSYEKIRISFGDGGEPANLSVTDLRLYHDDQQRPRRSLVDRLAARIAGGEGVILSVGLARAWLKPGDTHRRHWLQVNNLNLEEDSGWQLG